jgi:NOL1/NOP2/fmu family ribosome biogenesis protein
MMINRRLRFVALGFLVLILALFPVSSVFAAGLGHGFYGTVKVGGVDAGAGTVISARVGGTQYGSCTVTTPGSYTLIVQGDIAEGATIDFYVAGKKADQTFPFKDGRTTNLDLTVTPATYQLTISSITGGSVSTPGEGTFPYVEGTVVSLVASPGAGYYFVNWTGNVGTIANVYAASTTITMHGNYGITANFALIPPSTYQLTIASTTGGSVSTPGEGTFPYVEGRVVSLVASPGAGYYFVNWTATAGAFGNANAASTTFTMPAAAVTVTANFQAEGVPTYQLTMAADPEVGGTATDLTNASPYAAGTVVSIKAEAAEGYQFVNWTATAGEFDDANAAETTFTMPAEAVTVTANFEEVTPPPEVPTVTTQAATGISSDSATLNMKYTVGDFSTVQVRFAYKKSADAEWSYTDWVSKSADGTHAETLTGLVSRTEYEFKAQLKYNDTVIEGTTLQFTTVKRGCFIATAAYGTPAAEQIDVLREFRDVVLLESTVGSQFVALYYQLSPPVADFIAGSSFLKTLVRELLVDPIVWVVEATGDVWRN